MLSFLSFSTLHWIFVGRYWKVALLMPFVIQPTLNMKVPKVSCLAFTYWWTILIANWTFILGAVVIEICLRYDDDAKKDRHETMVERGFLIIAFMQVFNGITLIDAIRRIFKALKTRPDLSANECSMVMYFLSYLMYNAGVITTCLSL